MEIAKEIVIAMLQYGYISKTDNNEDNIKAVKEAYDAIYQQLRNSKNK